jgi:ATP-dependent RNA helicase SUPV3L1/SUV3
MRLWDVCQTPDFRKVSLDEHLRLVQTLYEHLTGREERVPNDWIDGQLSSLDRLDGDIDALARRLANVRTLAYVANRPDWLRDPAHWQGKTRALEDRLSDTLHERLMQRFIDRRTSVLMRALHVHDEVLAGVAQDGQVTVEGHFVGRLKGLQFEPAQAASALEDKALRGAAQRAVGPEMARRLGAIAGEADDAFALRPDGLVTWRGDAAGRLAGGSLFSPRVRLFGELGPAPARERAQRRLEAFLAAEAVRRLGPLKRLQDALADGSLKGIARGLAYRLVENGGVLDRREVAVQVRDLSQTERRALRSLGVRFGAFSLFLPALLEMSARDFTAPFALLETPDWRPSEQRLSRLPSPRPSARVLSAKGLRAVGAYAAPVEMLERLDGLLRASGQVKGPRKLSDQAREELGWSEEEAAGVMRALSFAPARKPKAGEPSAWRQRREPTPEPPRPDSPFAALASLKPAERRPTKRRRPRRPKVAAS